MVRRVAGTDGLEDGWTSDLSLRAYGRGKQQGDRDLGGGKWLTLWG